jgi:hypothetical protein
MTTETVGLILNFIGALALAIGTGIQTEISMSPQYGGVCLNDGKSFAGQVIHAAD